MLCLIFMIHKENKGFMFIWTSWTSVTYRENSVFLQHGSSFVVFTYWLQCREFRHNYNYICNRFGVRELMLLCPNLWSRFHYLKENLKPEDDLLLYWCPYTVGFMCRVLWSNMQEWPTIHTLKVHYATFLQACKETKTQSSWCKKQ